MQTGRSVRALVERVGTLRLFSAQRDAALGNEAAGELNMLHRMILQLRVANDEQLNDKQRVAFTLFGDGVLRRFAHDIAARAARQQR